MNDPPSDGNDSVIDIFVLSVSETVVPLFTEHLEKKGYRVTLFTDGTYLLETLRTGKPNLLICDTTTLDEEGFEVCRQIKADDDLWVIPVLILTRASSLTDLLHVLDCNADNFIPHPFDLSYSLSIIEGMLGTPVERQTPDQIKTQFKISHDDQIYVVAANRRKLLEFLLSSFEIGVSKSSELSHIKAELQTLSESAIQLEDYVEEQTRTIDTIKAALQQREQKISTLTREVEEKKRLLAQKTDEIDQFTEKLDHHKALIVTNDNNLRTLTQEKKDLEASYCSEIDLLRQQIAELSQEVDTAKTSLDTVQGDLEEEKIHGTSLECTLDLLVQQKELAEKSLSSITDEHEHLIVAFESEKERAASAEQELKAVTQAKTQSEQELSLIITGLNGTKDQQAADLSRLKYDLEEQSCQRISAENQVAALRKDKEQRESSLCAITAELEDLKSSFEAETCRATSAEQELKTVTQAKTQAEQELTGMIAALNETTTRQTADLSQLKCELETEAERRISAENQAESLRMEKEQSETSLRSSITALQSHLDDLQAKFETTCEALRAEENTTQSLKENLAEIVAENEKSFETLTLEHNRLMAAHTAEEKRAAFAEQERETLLRIKTQSEQELTGMITALNETTTRQTADLSRLKCELETEAERRLSAENQAESLRMEKEQSETSLRSSLTALKEQLDDLRAQRETEAERRLSAENQAESLRVEKEQSETSLRSSLTALKEQLDDLRAQRETEAERRLSAENQAESLRMEKEQSETSHRASLTALKEQLEDHRAQRETEAERRLSAENQAESLRMEKEQSETSHRASLTALKEQLEDHRAQLETEAERRITAENQIGSLHQGKEQSETSLRASITALKEQVDDLRVQLETTRTALENEENTTKLLKENLGEAVAENEKTELRVKADLESYKTTFVRLRHDLDEATAVPKTLERDLDAAKIENRLLADELNLANQSRAQSVQQVRSLIEELEKARAALDAERSLHQAGDTSLEELKQTLQFAEQKLRTSGEEQDKLNKILEEERRLRQIAETASEAAAQEQEHLKSELCAITDERERQENDRALKIKNLEKEFELVCSLQKSLEDQVTILTKEKLQAEQKVKSLTDEIDQARIALADEWVDHMDVNESLAAVGEESHIRKHSSSPEEAPGIKKETLQHLTEKEPELPVIVRSSLHALATVTTSPQQESPLSEDEMTSPRPGSSSEISSESVADIVSTFCDEDLFEEGEPVLPEADLSPQPAGPAGTGPEETGREVSPEFTASDREKGEEGSPDEGCRDENEPDNDSIGGISREPGVPSPHLVFSFNRKQWFDLLKWAHHSTALTHDQRLQIVRMGRLIQKDRKLTRKQEEQVNEMIALVQALGYRPS